MEATTILPLPSDFLFCRNVLIPFAVVVGLKADGVAGAGNGLMWGGMGCVYGALSERRSLPFQQSFFLQPELHLRGLKRCCSASEAGLISETASSSWLKLPRSRTQFDRRDLILSSLRRPFNYYGHNE